MLSLAEVLIKKELPFVTDWYSLDSVKTNNLWKDICIIKIAYAIYLSRDCSVIHALSKAFNIFLRENFGAHCMSIIPRSFMEEHDSNRRRLVRNSSRGTIIFNDSVLSIHFLPNIFLKILKFFLIRHFTQSFYEKVILISE